MPVAFAVVFYLVAGGTYRIVERVFLAMTVVFFGYVAKFAQIGMAEKRIVVESHLGIQCEQAAIRTTNKRIDLNQ